MDPITQVRNRLSEITGEIRTIDQTVASEHRLTLNEDESARYAELSAERETLEAREAQLVAEEARRAKAAEGAVKFGTTREPVATITSEPRVYDPAARHSYFLDLARISLGQGDGDGGVGAARERMQRHEAELRVELPAREAARDAAARAQNDAHFSREGLSDRARETMFEKRVNPNRTDGQGGFFVPPLWIMDEYIDLPRFGRTTANLCRQFALPSGTDSINLPKISTGTATAVQSADAGAVQSTDLTDTSVSAPVRTIAGQQDIAIQLLDQSPVSFDEVVFADLIADYNQKLDVQVISGSGSAGQVTGLLTVSGTNTVTYTDASPTLPKLWPSLLGAASQVAKNRKMPANGLVMTPSIWYWALSQLDSTNRPLIVSSPAFSAMADPGALDVDGPAGVLTFGMPAYLDGNLPSNLGVGTNQSTIVAARWSDVYLWEGSMRTRVLSEVLSGTLQVRLQVYNYVAFMGNRRPEAISVIGGTGLIPAAGF